MRVRLVFAFVAVLGAHAQPVSRSGIQTIYGSFPLTFEAHQGEGKGAADFLAHGDGYALLLHPTEAILRLAGRGDTRSANVSLRWMGSNQKATATGLDLMPA